MLYNSYKNLLMQGVENPDFSLLFMEIDSIQHLSNGIQNITETCVSILD